MKDYTSVKSFFPSRKFLIEVVLDTDNEEMATKLLKSVANGTELLPGLTITKIYPSVATVDSIDKNNTKF